MSLINEALKRARLEAAHQDAAKKGYVLTSDQSLHRPGHTREIPRRKILRAGLITLVIALLGFVGYALYYFGVERSTYKNLTVDAAGSEALDVALGLSSNPTEPNITGDDPANESIAEVDPGMDLGLALSLDRSQSQPENIRAQGAGGQLLHQRPLTEDNAGSALESVTSQAPGRITSSPEVSTQAAPTLARSTPVIEPGGGTPPRMQVKESYEREFTLSDGTRVELGGIAWSESGPYALVDGRVIGVGEFVGDLVIESIHPTHIMLKGRDRRVQLTLR